jgi:hypothetical protein
MIKPPPMVSVDTETGEVEWLDKLPADAAFVIVMALSVPLILPDNLLGRCSGCDRAIQFRPETAPAPIKLCLECAPAWVEGMESPQ